MTEKPTFAGRIIALLVGFVLFAVAAEIAMRLLMPQWPEFYSARFMVAAHSDKFGPFSLGRSGFNGWFGSQRSAHFIRQRRNLGCRRFNDIWLGRGRR